MNWISVKQRVPDEGVVCRMYQLFGWAVRKSGEWMSMDDCGNLYPLMWSPTHWIPEMQNPPNPIQEPDAEKS